MKKRSYDPQKRWRLGVFCWTLWGMLLGAGCQNQAREEGGLKRAENWPEVMAAELWKQDWKYGHNEVFEERGKEAPAAEAGIMLETRHYRIYTTIDDELLLRRVVVVMETAGSKYWEWIGQKPAGEKKPAVYILRDREQWKDFTRYWTAGQAEEYMQVQAGGYTFAGAIVMYFLDRESSLAVLAHEGWHQFVSVNFAYPLPAWAEEGIATEFEGMKWERGRVEISPEYNIRRQERWDLLRRQNKRIPRQELLTGEAGDFAGPGKRGGDYYAELYGLMQYLRAEGKMGNLQALVREAYLGQYRLPEELLPRRGEHPARRKWNREAGGRLFDIYIKKEN